MKTIVITGATSMLGVATIKHCLKNDISVIAFARKNSKNLCKIPSSNLINIVECNLEDMAAFNPSGLRADAFIHFGWDLTDSAGRHDAYRQLKNVQYTLDAVQLAHKLGCKKFVGAGSQAEFGIAHMPLSAHTPVQPLTPYGIAKYAAGKLCGTECVKLGISYNWVRIVSTYGTNDNNGTLMFQLIHNAINNIPMSLSSCEQIWDYLYEDDAGQAFLDITTRGINAKTYVLGSGQGRPLKEYVQTVINVANPHYKPHLGAVALNPYQPTYLVADISELTADTGWLPTTTFANGIQRIVQTINPA